MVKVTKFDPSAFLDNKPPNRVPLTTPPPLQPTDAHNPGASAPQNGAPL